MKIGILTYHWGANYGGVLQAYALQRYLKETGHDAIIINFAPITPKDNLLFCFKARSIKTIRNNIKEYLKEKKFKKFRSKHLLMTERYYSSNEIEQSINQFNIIITGSDQVWNPFTALDNGAPYFLPFKGKFKKISFAASLGCEDYPPELLKKLKQFITDFDFISVRENSAYHIIKNCVPEKDVQIIPDPTFLFGKDLISAFNETIKVKNKDCFFYILHQNKISRVKKYLSSKYSIQDSSNSIFSNLSIEDWILNIKHSKLVVTNSYHGVIFSILSHTNFIVMPIEGSMEGMNDRINTLLNYFSMTDRVFCSDNIQIIEKIIKNDINWPEADRIIDILKEKGQEFISQSIHE